jgi:hypothetical protein
MLETLKEDKLYHHVCIVKSSSKGFPMWCSAKKFVIEAKNEVWLMLLYTKKLC